MGYSCTVLASYASEKMVQLLQAQHGDCGGSSNTWGGKNAGDLYWFEERGREQDDGAVTGSIFKGITTEPGKPGSCRKCGTYRVNPNGTVARWPGSTKEQREYANLHAQAEFARVFGQATLDRQLAKYNTGAIA